jgi:pilus assembly protein CpaB
MSSKQIRIVAIVLLVLAGLLALLALQAARHTAAPAPAQGVVATHAVVVTTRAVPAGKPLPADALQVLQLPIDPGGAYQDVARVAGQVPLVNLGANVPVLESQLLAGLARQIPDGERAMAVAVDEVIGVGNQVQPGDFVDVFVVLRRDSQEIPQSQTRMLLSRLRVLAYGNGAVNEAPKQQGEQMMARREGAKTAVLSVPLEQVSKLVMAQQAGRLMLALRNPTDEAMPSDGMFADPPGVLQARAGVPPKPTRAGGQGCGGREPSGTGGRTARAPNARASMRPAVLPAGLPGMVATARRDPQNEGNGVEMIRAGKRTIE